MTKARVADYNTYRIQVVKVESLRSDVNISRTMMVYQLYKELTVEQNAKLQAYLERERERFRQGNSTRGSGPGSGANGNGSTGRSGR
jgi:hypothetical protein